jgi:hypothetical protein
MENGDDWFHLEDGDNDRAAVSSLMAKTLADYPVRISTISGSNTDLMRLRYKAQPKHTVIHIRACSFTVIHTSNAQKASLTTHGHSALTVQVSADDL